MCCPMTSLMDPDEYAQCLEEMSEWEAVHNPDVFVGPPDRLTFSAWKLAEAYEAELKMGYGDVGVGAKAVSNDWIHENTLT